MIAISDTLLVAIIVAATSGIGTVFAGVAALLAVHNRRELQGSDANGNTMREEIQGIERALTEHIRQTEHGLQGGIT